MRGLFIRFGVTWIAVFLAGYMIPGIRVDTVGAGIAAAILLSLLNAVIRPILYMVSIPLILLTLGLFTVVINALLLELVAWLVQGVHVNGFWPAFWGAVVISIVSTILNFWVSAEGHWEIVSHESRRPPRIIN
jgi:putative membrane protein